jgi:hypothetical protein
MLLLLYGFGVAVQKMFLGNLRPVEISVCVNAHGVRSHNVRACVRHDAHFGRKFEMRLAAR